MEIKYELVLNGMTWSAAEEIEYNTIGTFKTSNSNTPVYYIFWCKGYTYTLQEQYIFHALDPPVIIPEGELFFSQFYDTNEKNFLLVSQSRWSNPCHGEVKTSCDALHWIDSGQQ